ncbi:DsbC family protein [Arenicella xantha]|uniref:Thiol:disulfide interchange protein n=1 Tax=Arenicella xantha TaxID=644221 RepID=A0A395JKH2_9GAMM|nr:DsbC family protein [Arenicella xantha]RBP49278.1 thiol:disulfide interchange protein DsbC [Arenicella xantha]
MKYMIKATIGLFAAIMFAPQLVLAENASPEIERVRAELVKMVPPAADAEILTTPAKGVYRLELDGGFYYAYVDGDHILFGDLINTESKINLGEVAKSERTSQIISSTSLDKMIVYGPKDAKRHITVFTDIDCGYCRKLHQEVPELTAAGIQVRYLAFPRAGVGSESHKKYVSVWCNADQQTALTDAKAGKAIAPASCENPVEETYLLGRKVGVEGTPTIIFDDGTVTPGYIPSAQLIDRLGLGSPTASN